MMEFSLSRRKEMSADATEAAMLSNKYSNSNQVYFRQHMAHKN